MPVSGRLQKSKKSLKRAILSPYFVCGCLPLVVGNHRQAAGKVAGKNNGTDS
jgi:hypothetical protein